MKGLLKVLARNRDAALARRAPTILAAKDDDEATVYLFGAIVRDAVEAEYWGGVAAETLVPELAKLQAKTIHLRIDSPGGDVFGAQAISQALREHSAKVIAHVDGLAASAATVIATASDEIVMAEGAMYMVHRAWTFAWGNKNDILETAALLEKIDGTLAGQYAAKTGGSVEDMLAVMDEETWMTADEAVAAKFVDRIATSEKKAQASWDLSAYAKAPKLEQQPQPTFASAVQREWQARQLRLPRT